VSNVARETCALILAAGAGERFRASGGEGSKLLAELDGRPVLEHVVSTACAVSELGRVLVVLGCDAGLLRERVSFDRAEIVVCRRWRAGQAASLRCGARALGDAERVLVLLGDEPRVSGDAIRAVAAAEPPARALYGDRPGHPVLLGPAQLRALRRLRGDQGARSLLADAAPVRCAVPAGGSEIQADIDTIGDLMLARDRRTSGGLQVAGGLR
jgi:molybdenum cofactor cytidylyltransferase